MKIVMCVLLMSVSLRAQDRASHAILAAGEMLDFATTRVAIHNGAREVGLAGNGVKAQAAVKIGHFAIVETLSYFVNRSGYHGLARNHRVVWGAVLVGFSAWNGHVIAGQHGKHTR